jgi:hypothetical protein
MQRTLPVFLSALLFCPTLLRADQALVDFSKPSDLAAVESHNVKLSRNGDRLRLETGQEGREPCIVCKAPGGRWDLSAFQDVAVEVKNCGQNGVRFFCQIDSPRGDGSTSYMCHSVELSPGEKTTLRVALPRRFSSALREKLQGMRGVPGQISIQSFDLAKVSQLSVFLAKSNSTNVLEIGAILACGTVENAVAQQEAKFFPLIDTFGQYRHKDWPGKTYAVEDLAARRQEEDADLAAHPGPNDRDQYGGWKNGPQLKATGWFRTEKHGGKWWLVDPEGRLFWAHAIDWVAPDGGTTLVTGREPWFADLPGHDSPLAQFYKREGGGFQGPGNDADRNVYTSFNFSKANLLRKYGQDWLNQYARTAIRRLHSWGVTVAAGGCAEVCDVHKMPYTVQAFMPGKAIPTSGGFWCKFTDVFDADLPRSARANIKAACAKAADDPWCVGVFIDNEMGWGAELSLPLAALRAPADQPAKRALIGDLRKKYQSIDRLNEAWATHHASWDALLASTDPPDTSRAQQDLLAFAARFSQQYFRIARDALKEAAPHLLYLGCRFSSFNAVACRAAARHCDVVSFNHYKRSAADVHLPADADAPILISEFHFGALDRGLFHTGLVGLADQRQRAATYKAFLNSALDSAAIVGTHWFMFGDEATTGFGNRENYQIGFVDVCDTPYPEIVTAAREVSEHMYPRHSGRRK